MNNRLNEQQEALLRTTARLHDMSDQEATAMLRGMAVMIAEYEVLKTRLVELGEITNTIPVRWTKNNETIVDLEEAIRQHMTKRGK